MQGHDRGRSPVRRRYRPSSEIASEQGRRTENDLTVFATQTLIEAVGHRRRGSGHRACARSGSAVLRHQREMWDVSAVGRIIGGNVVEHLMQEAKSKSAVIKRSVVVNHVRTSVTLENEFRDCLQEIASIRRISTSALITEIADNRTFSNLSSAIRVFVLEYYKGSNAKP